MAFVYDGETLTAGKSDLAPSTVPADKRVTAAEYNALVAAVTDLRAALLTGQYHGLVSTPGAAVAATGSARLRLSGTRLQASVNGGAYRSVSDDVVYVRDYGAVGDGVTDDYAAILAAMTAAGERPLVFDALTYAVASEVDTSGCASREWRGVAGSSGARTIIKATGGQRATVNVHSGVMRCSGVTFDGGRSALYSVRIESAALSTFTDCRAVNALRDGVHLPATGINDTIAWYGLWTSGNGTLHVSAGLFAAYAAYVAVRAAIAGTCATSSGSMVVTFSGAPDLTTLGIRAGDPVRIGGSAQYGMVVSIDSATQLTVAFDTATGLSATTDSGLDYAIGVGDGYHEARHGDNNIAAFAGTQLHRGNAGYGLVFDGLYGPRVSGTVQIDSHPFWGMRVGTDGGGAVLSSVFDGLYFEGVAPKSMLLRSAQMTSIRGCLALGSLAASASYCGNAANCSGVFLGEDVETIGNSTTSDVPSLTVGAWHLAGVEVRGPLRLQGGVSAVTAGVLTRSGYGASSGGAVCLVNCETSNQAIASVALAAVPASEVLWVGVYGSYTATLTPGVSLQLRGLCTLKAGEWIGLVYQSSVWREFTRSVGAGGLMPDSTGSPGNVTQNDAFLGRVAIAAAAASVTVTNNRVTATSVIVPVLQSVDATLTQILTVVPAAGSFTITGNAAATAACNVGWRLEA